ncbi:MAG: UvrD-helicase domain-containing protein [Bacteroidales bacterium]|nr:UvrD-helicase domain-containing protein [Bacteroidales bacterium]
MIRILKASAGSGKTYNLAETYIRLLLGNEDPRAYRHILAVTFTNKATDEMKGRILKELYKLSKEPGGSPYAPAFVPELFPTLEDLQVKAGKVLFNILHDYGAFAVSTIDRFFQQTLKAFSREIGQFSSYQVELDRDSLIRESVDRILDSLTEDSTQLLNWLSNSMLEQLEQGGKFNLGKDLQDMAVSLKSDQHRTVVEQHGIDEEEAYSKENLANMKSILRSFTTSYVSKLKAAAGAVQDAFDSCGLSPDATASSFIGSMLRKIAAMDSRSEIPEMGKTFLKRWPDYDEWFKKTDRGRYAGLEGDLMPPVKRLVEVYDGGKRLYGTARILLGQINDLGIASDLSREFRNLMKEKNVLCLDDSNVILKDIIDGTDAPFIYEKLGVRFEHFLLDEFQDTSRVQWENFRPLVANSDSQGFENLLVGDVKQSIYRWRGSDWNLMAREVAEEFPGCNQDSLKGNWRSLDNIVGFNNGFFEYAATYLDGLYGENTGITISSIYGKGADGFEKQVVRSKEAAQGSVEAVFCLPDQEMDYVLSTVEKVLAAGALPGDITVLVRKKDDGSEVAAFLMDHGYDVISDDSLRVKSSPVVRKLVSLLSSVSNPEDTIGSYLAEESGLDTGQITYHSLIDLCERLLRLLSEKEKEAFCNETLYIQSFMDYVSDFVAVNGNSLDEFLDTWEKADPRVSSPSDISAVRVMTIHKSKGLEFPYVIFPFSEKVDLFRSGRVWTVPDLEGTPVEGAGKAAFDVQLSSKSAGTLFAEDYKRDLLLQYIDNINTYYVALTRASKGMTIISDIKSTPQKDFAGILGSFLGQDEGFSCEETEDGATIYSVGELYDFSSLDRKVEDIGKLEPGYPSFPLNPEPGPEDTDVRERGRLKFKADSLDFFTDEGASRQEARHNGTVMHDILSRVIVPSDLQASVRKAVMDGEVEPPREASLVEFLSSRIASHPEWFPSDGKGIFNEVSLIDTDGREWRPDRVVVRDGSVTVVDYKFGEREARYARQVARYASIYRRMGWEYVDTAIWYVNSDLVE